MAQKKRVCIVGGGATGVAMAWCLGQNAQVRDEWAVTLIHKENIPSSAHDGPEQLGGHSLTEPVEYKGHPLLIDIGVQFIQQQLYPNLFVMLYQPMFESLPVNNYDQLKVSCAFPDGPGGPRNWGNFAAYQSGPAFAMYSSAMRANCEKFEKFLATPGLHGALQSIDQYFAAHGDEYTDVKTFVNDFVTPYLSIMNGYGGPDMGQMQVVDLAVIFDLQLAHFTKPGIGWSQFSSGSSSWVQAMAQAAKAALDLQIMTDVTVLSVATNPTTGKVSVAWGSKGPVVVDEFDKVILTTDMWTNANLLGGANNSTYWNQLYSKYLDKPPVPPQGPPPDPKTAKWNLMQGACYIHTDASMLAPSLRPLQQETLQFNAYFAGRPDGSYDIAKTFTTYILKNLLPGDQAQHADGLYLRCMVTSLGRVTSSPRRRLVSRSRKTGFMVIGLLRFWTDPSRPLI